MSLVDISPSRPAWFEQAVATEPEARQVEVDGASINFLQWGNPLDPGLLFIQGCAAHAHWWSHVAPSFLSRYSAVAIDLSGHGDSAHRDGYSLDGWCDKVVTVIDAAELRDTAEHIARRSLKRVPEGWTWKFDKRIFIPRRREAAEFLAAIRCRVALLRAEHRLLTRDIGKYMYEQLGRVAPVIELPTAGNHPMLDVPLILITAIRSLLADWEHSIPYRRRT